jgi:hypothetical protein
MNTKHETTITKSTKSRRRLYRITALLFFIALGFVGFERLSSTRGTAKSVLTSPVSTNLLTAAPLPGTFSAVNTGAGDQYYPRVACDLVTYTNDNLLGSTDVHYFDLSTRTDQAIPGNGADLLADVYGSRIALTEVTFLGTQIVIFDTLTQTRTTLPFYKLARPALAENSMVFEDYSLYTEYRNTNVGVYDFASGALTRLTNDDLPDKFPAISPDGKVVTWQKCELDDTGCDIYAATLSSPGSFVTRLVTEGIAAEDRRPATNGQVIVYTSNRGGDYDVYIQSVNGGPATQIPLPGEQRIVNISGNLISFESAVAQVDGSSQYDVFVYNLANGALYRVTDTPVNEVINDISLCGDGSGSIVYSAPDSDYNIYAFAFHIENSETSQISQLIALVRSFNLHAGIENSLIAKLNAAASAINVSDTGSACQSLTDFINQTSAQSGKKLTAAQAIQLVNAARQIKTALGCP